VYKRDVLLTVLFEARSSTPPPDDQTLQTFLTSTIAVNALTSEPSSFSLSQNNVCNNFQTIVVFLYSMFQTIRYIARIICVSILYNGLWHDNNCISDVISANVLSRHSSAYIQICNCIHIILYPNIVRETISWIDTSASRRFCKFGNAGVNDLYLWPWQCLDAGSEGALYKLIFIHSELLVWTDLWYDYTAWTNCTVCV
jgi:hypothetical protein